MAGNLRLPIAHRNPYRKCSANNAWSPKLDAFHAPLMNDVRAARDGAVHRVAGEGHYLWVVGEDRTFAEQDHVDNDGLARVDVEKVCSAKAWPDLMAGNAN